MTSVDVKTPDGKTAGKVELPADIFDVQVNVPLIHQVVVGQLAAARQGTHDVKRRGEVSGSGKKPFKQKGTGNARQDPAVLQTRLVEVLLTQFVHVSMDNAHLRK